MYKVKYMKKDMKLRKFITTTIREYLNEQKETQNNIQKLTLYSVTFHTSNSSDSVYYGTDKEDAFYEYNSFNDIPERWFNRSDMSVEITRQTNQYKFIHELDYEYETIEDYPIDEYYDDSSVYELVDEGDVEFVDTRTIEPKNKQSDELLNDVTNYFKNEYGNFKYNTINVYDEGEEYKGCIQLRIADHTENIHNIDRYGSCDCYISVVISDYDATNQRFGMVNAFERRRNEFELKFQSEDNFYGIIEEIQNQIEECREMILEK